MKKLLEPKNWWFWILLALTFKSIILVYYIHHIDPRLRDATYAGFWGAFGGDAAQYLKPIENFLSTGSYTPDERMPGYGIFYYFLRLFLDPVKSLNSLLLLQLLTSAISTYVLALTTQMVTRKNTAFYYSFLLYILSSCAFSWDYLIITESLTISFLVFFIYFLCLYFVRAQKLHYLLISGSFLTWIVFLKPVYIILFAIVLPVLFVFHCRERSRSVLPGALLFMSSFVVFDGAWIVRNYNQSQRIIPLYPHMYVSEIRNTCAAPLIRFIQSWGGEFAWDAGTASRWFYPNLKNMVCAPCAEELEKNYTVSIPDYIYTSKFNRDSLVIMRGDLMKWDSLRKVGLNAKQLEEYRETITIRLDTYTASLQSEKPFLFYIQSRWIYLKRFLFGRVQTPPLIFHPYNKLKIGIFILSEAIYYFALTTGLLMAFWTVFKSLNLVSIDYVLLLISLIMLFGVFVFPIALKYSEHRYLAPEYPFIVICSAACYFKLRDKFL